MKGAQSKAALAPARAAIEQAEKRGRLTALDEIESAVCRLSYDGDEFSAGVAEMVLRDVLRVLRSTRAKASAT